MRVEIKKAILFCNLILILLISACSTNQVVDNEITIEENNSESTYDLNEAIKNAKCVTEYPDTATVDDFDTVKFVKYEQDGDESNGAEDIEWIILEKKDDETFILSKNILEYIQYNNVDENVTWENSSSRKWLNNDFYNVLFNNKEEKLIILQKYEMVGNEHTKINHGNNTKDKLVFLSFGEMKEYFEHIDPYTITIEADVIWNNQAAKAYDTEYSLQKYNRIAKELSSEVSEEWQNFIFERLINNHKPIYSLRTSGKNSSVDCVYYDGDFYADARVTDFLGVRPAMWVKYK